MLSALGISEISAAAASTGASTGRAKQPAVRATVVVHGEAMVAEGIAAALSRYPGLAVVGVATSLLEVERWEGRADAVVLDPGLPRAREAIARLRSKGIRVVLVGEDDGGSAEISVPTRAPISALARALVPEAAARRRGRLTAREEEVLSLAAAGLTAGQIGRRLTISAKTVEQRKHRAYTKLGVSNQAAAIRIIASSGPGLWVGATFGPPAEGSSVGVRPRA